MNHGIPEEWATAIKSIFRQFPEVESAVLFGSRATGNYRNASDIDLALEGVKIKLDHVVSMLALVRELNLPVELDLVVRHTITNPDFERHIREFGVAWYRRQAGLD